MSLLTGLLCAAKHPNVLLMHVYMLVCGVALMQVPLQDPGE